ncbi:RDD family protein [Sporosarcina aquimarina]|uniref:RDD family protein n=1 Tax=Sporosarcina aquimarina TaxID=114975 RepID=A0ABU4G225_9BACL|nr:RDD family protein [Sporosarcina aquimarina]MDW0110432.1 RDD family protein [Sporosarcina aquimarina]
MKTITKKRMKAYGIDMAITMIAIGATEYFLRKKVKSEAVHALITPSVITYSLECVQLLNSGQTVGYKKMGLVLKDQNGMDLTTYQLMKRIFYRDSINGFKLLANRSEFEQDEGERLPHDVFAGTIVKEV